MKRSQIELRKKIFFYAEDDVAHYDDDADLNTPHYTEMHRFASDLTRLLLAQRHVTPASNTPFVFLDIGSGTGASSLSILRDYPAASLVAIDLCQPMHVVFQRKAVEVLGEKQASSRIHYVTGDIADVEVIFPRILAAVDEFPFSAPPLFAVSALTFHHLIAEEKAAAYQKLHSILAPSGFFLNADFFGYRTPEFQALAQTHTLDWIRTQHNPTTTEYPAALAKMGSEADNIAAKWIEHCERYNVLLPIEPSPGGASPQGDIELLVHAGFRSVECPLRQWQSAVMVAAC